MELRRYSSRHDAVLQVIGDFIKSHLATHYFFTIDSPSGVYSFPHHITPTSLRPDIVWWNDQQRELWLFELTVSYESLVADAGVRKKRGGQLAIEQSSSQWRWVHGECWETQTSMTSEKLYMPQERNLLPYLF